MEKNGERDVSETFAKARVDTDIYHCNVGYWLSKHVINPRKDFFPQNTKLPELDDQTKKAQKENDKKFKNQLNEKCEEFVVKQETGDAEDTSEDEEETPEDDLPMNDIKIEAVDESELLEQTQHDIEDIQSDYQSDAEAEAVHEDGAEENKEGEEATEDGINSDSEKGPGADEKEEVDEDKEAVNGEEGTDHGGETAEETGDEVKKEPPKKIVSVDLTEDDDEEKEEIDKDKKLISENKKLLEETSADFESKNCEENSKNRPGSEEKENLENQQSTKIPESSASLDSYMERLSIIVNELYKNKGRDFTKNSSKKEDWLQN